MPGFRHQLQQQGQFHNTPIKFLFDRNLSRRLPLLFRDSYPASNHVSFTHEPKASDKSIHDYALAHGYTIVTKDSDFNRLSRTLGLHPKLIVITLGNCSTRQIHELVIHNTQEIRHFHDDTSRSTLHLPH